MSEVGGCAARSDEITQREETSMAQKMYYPPEELVKNAAVSGMDHYKRLVAEAGVLLLPLLFSRSNLPTPSMKKFIDLSSDVIFFFSASLFLWTFALSLTLFLFCSEGSMHESLVYKCASLSLLTI